MKNSLFITSISLLLSSSLSPSLSAAEPIWDANKVEMISSELGAGVYAYYDKNAKTLNATGGAAATSSGLIAGTKGALLIDTMLNQRLHQQINALSQTLGGKPLIYAVNTSAHGDHSYGNMYLSKETLLIQHAQSQAFIATHLDKDKAFMIQNFGAGRGIEQIQPRSADIIIPKDGKITLDLGGKTAEIIDFGFAQTGGDLWVWQPDTKVIWSGNPIIASKPALPWLLDGKLLETLATLQRVYDFLPEDAKVIPGHGVAIKKQDILWHIDYLTAVKNQVQAAINKGLTQEQTVAAVTLPEFTGYALFNWVHPGLNVPAAYKDLSQ
jgi:glyoxylase-like metal-dependent hydrolase (beta-lactamase superfamily II)